MVGLRIIAHQDVKLPVAVEVEHLYVQAIGGWSRQSFAAEAAGLVPQDVVALGRQPVRSPQHFNALVGRGRRRSLGVKFQVAHPNEIAVAIAVEIGRGHAGGPSQSREFGGWVETFRRATQQEVVAQAAHHDIKMSVLVKVSGGQAGQPAVGQLQAHCGTGGELPVTLVAVQRERARRIHGPRGGDQQVFIAITIHIFHRQAASVDFRDDGGQRGDAGGGDGGTGPRHAGGFGGRRDRRAALIARGEHHQQQRGPSHSGNPCGRPTRSRAAASWFAARAAASWFPRRRSMAAKRCHAS